jgi:hypothetical protein
VFFRTISIICLYIFCDSLNFACVLYVFVAVCVFLCVLSVFCSSRLSRWQVTMCAQVESDSDKLLHITSLFR